MSGGFSLGSCCVCGKVDDTVRNLVALPWRLPVEYRGKGWGCVVCDLPADGVMAVICDQCAQEHRGSPDWAWLKFFCAGFVRSDRIPLSNVDVSESNSFHHDLHKHEVEAATIRFAS